MKPIDHGNNIINENRDEIEVSKYGDGTMIDIDTHFQIADKNLTKNG